MTYDRSWAGDDAEHHAAVVLKALGLTREQPARSLVRSACESLVRFHERVAATGQPDSRRVAALLAQVREVLLPVAEQVRQC